MHFEVRYPSGTILNENGRLTPDDIKNLNKNQLCDIMYKACQACNDGCYEGKKVDSTEEIERYLKIIFDRIKEKKEKTPIMRATLRLYNLYTEISDPFSHEAKARRVSLNDTIRDMSCEIFSTVRGIPVAEPLGSLPSKMPNNPATRASSYKSPLTSQKKEGPPDINFIS